MAVPATSGLFKTDLLDMNVGDYIACKATSINTGTVVTLSDLGASLATATSNEISTTTLPTSPSGYFYFIKVTKGRLVADRNIHGSVTWAIYNNNNLIEGKSVTIGTNNVFIRSLTGGSAYATSAYARASVDYSTGYAFPEGNEYDKYIVLSDLGGTATPNNDNVWHYSASYSWCQEMEAYDVASSATFKTSRGKSAVNNYGSKQTNAGFRPLLEFNESNAPSYTIWGC